MASNEPTVYQFQAEINELLSLIINTFYTNNDVFLRELISNASDANNKARHEYLCDPESREGREHFIKISTREGVLVVEDNGIGMSKEDMVQNLGTIASSGTKQFAMACMSANTTQSTPQDLIGQFGVGFYSAYLVAEHVSVYSRKDAPDSSAYLWSSAATGSFEITPVPDESMPACGTRIELTLKESAQSYLEESTLKSIVGKYSGFLGYPIQLLTRKTVSEPVERSEGDADKPEGHIEEVSEEDTEKATETQERVVEEWTTLNTTKPIWKRNSDDVTDEEYAAFYQSVSNDWEPPLTHRHYTAEGQVEFKALLFVPRRAPFDMFKTKEQRERIKLYVRGVLVSDKNEDLLPDWLTFVSGIVDSDDLPLNVSRETMQQNTVIKIIRKSIVKRAIEMVEHLADAEDQSDFDKFYSNFHQSIKLGVHEDGGNKSRLTNLLRFQSAKHVDKISLKQYVEANSSEANIYYLTGPSRDFLLNSAFTKGILARGHDVLFMVDPIDEYVCQQLREYEGKQMVDISKDNELFQTDASDYAPLCAQIKDVLSDHVEKVVVSSRLGGVPCAVSSSKYGWGANMERVMKSQSLANNTMQGMGAQKRVLEINPEHALIRQLSEQSSEDPAHAKSVIRIMYDMALISSGYMHDDPSSFGDRVFNMLAASMVTAEPDAEPDAPAPNTPPCDAEPEPTESLEEID